MGSHAWPDILAVVEVAAVFIVVLVVVIAVVAVVVAIVIVAVTASNANASVNKQVISPEKLHGRGEASCVSNQYI